MEGKCVKYVLALILTLLFLGNVRHAPLLFAADEQPTPKDQNIKDDIDYNKEDRDVGLKRMEILDKTLSPELLARKRAVVQSIEQDYNNKVSTLIKRLTPAIADNTRAWFPHLSEGSCIQIGDPCQYVFHPAQVDFLLPIFGQLNAVCFSPEYMQHRPLNNLAQSRNPGR